MSNAIEATINCFKQEVAKIVKVIFEMIQVNVQMVGNLLSVQKFRWVHFFVGYSVNNASVSKNINYIIQKHYSNALRSWLHCLYCLPLFVCFDAVLSKEITTIQMVTFALSLCHYIFWFYEIYGCNKKCLPLILISRWIKRSIDFK